MHFPAQTIPYCNAAVQSHYNPNTTKQPIWGVKPLMCGVLWFEDCVPVRIVTHWGAPWPPLWQTYTPRKRRMDAVPNGETASRRGGGWGDGSTHQPLPPLLPRAHVEIDCVCWRNITARPGLCPFARNRVCGEWEGGTKLATTPTPHTHPRPSPHALDPAFTP